ncbi:MAG: primosomal protein N' [Eubacteriales bacterium]|nr:primosomal protein N' [Eubacteriales bacterium]
MTDDKLYCRVVLKEATRQFDQEYTYAVPEELRSEIATGSLVEVPFGRGNRQVDAYCIALQSQPPSDFYIKPLVKIKSDRPVLTDDQIELAVKMRERYLCTYGAALRCMTPSTVMSVGDRMVRFAALVDPTEAAARLSSGEIDRLGHVRVIQMLLDYESIPTYELQSACQVSAAVLKTLEKKGLISFFRGEVRRELEDDLNLPAIQPDFKLNGAQEMAVNRICESMIQASEQFSWQECLLYGITGSGKTEVYLQSARQALADGKGVIILVPEISLTPQMVARIKSRFGNKVAVLHSRLTPAERYEQWQRILREEVLLVVGARSAIFAPLKSIGLIILDEEQEGSYKSETHPRYHARDIARMRAYMHHSALVLGSATPSVESYYRSQSGRSILLGLPERIGSAGLPRTIIADMRQELRDGNRTIFSYPLQQALRNIQEQKQQAMIFINRRGHSGFVLCRSCGQTVKCNTCSVSMTNHASLDRSSGYDPRRSEQQEQLICHYCGKITRMPKKCPVCGSSQIGRFGVGTQQVEEHLARAFPGIRTLRMDQDTTAGRSAHAQILKKFADHEADVLIGTQMIAKGHDFPNVTVVGILAADQLLGMSDFRASERAFQLIVQAAGRAGRASEAGQVIIQAYNTDDYAIQAAAAQDYEAFYKQEIAFRKMMKYPPFGSIGLIVLAGANDNEVRDRIDRLYRAMLKWQNDNPDFLRISLTEPGRAPLSRIRGRYRWRILLYGEHQAAIAEFMAHTVGAEDMAPLTVTIDVDPWQML